jgi:DNA-binding response OmpR family regulator
MIRVLWLAKKRRLKTYRLCEKIWRSSSTPDKTIKQAIYRLNEKLESNSFPYKICPIKSERTGEITGYGLRFSK